MTLSITVVEDAFGSSNTRGINSTHSIDLYRVSASDANRRYTLLELMQVINSHSHFDVSGLGASDLSTSETDPRRSFVVSKSSSFPANHDAVIFCQTGTYYHEIGASTLVDFANDVFMPVMGCGSVVSNYVRSNFANNRMEFRDTSYTSTHEINNGYVIWRCPDLFQAFSDSALRPVDLGSPDKSGSDQRAQLAVAMLSPSTNQTFIMSAGHRLQIEIASNTSQRQDLDFVGEGQVQLEARVIRASSSVTSFPHNVMQNPANDVTLYYNEGGFSGTIETFSQMPTVQTHPYINKSVRASSAYDPLVTGTGQYALTCTGSNGSAGEGTNGGIYADNLVVQGSNAAIIRQFWQMHPSSGSSFNDTIWVDPSFYVAGGNTTPTRSRNAGNTLNSDYIFMRSNAVINRDAAGMLKSTTAYVLGNQSSSTARAYRQSAADRTTARFPAIRTAANGGTYSVRSVRSTDSKGVHYLQDATLHQGQIGDAASEYTFYDGDTHQSWLIHRGGIHRYSHSVSMRTEGNFGTSLDGASGRITNSDVDDIDGIKDAFIDLFKTGITGAADGNYSTITTGEVITVDGLPDLTQTEWDAIAACSFFRTTSEFAISSISRVSASSVTVTIGTVVVTTTLNDNDAVSFQCSNYRWNIPSSNDGDFVISTPSGSNVTLTYSMLAALIIAKLEIVMTRKEATLGAETTTFSTTQDSLWAGGSTTLNTLLDRIVGDAAPRVSAGGITAVTKATNAVFTLTEAAFNASDLEIGEYITVAGVTGATSFNTDYRITNITAQTLSGVTTYLITTNVNSSAFTGTPVVTAATISADSRNPSYVYRDTTTATTIHLPRVRFVPASGTTITLNPDSSNNSLNFGSDYTVPSGVQINGTFTDSAGTASLITLNLPSGVVASDLKASAVYQNDASSDAWTIGANPTISTSNNVTSLTVTSSQGPEATGNTDDVWYLAVVGAGIVPQRMQFTGAAPAGTTITLAADAFYPSAAAVTKSGTITVVPESLSSGTINSLTEVLAVQTLNATYLNTTVRLAFLFNGYDSQSDTDRLKIDIGDALNTNAVADFVGRYGTGGIAGILQAADVSLAQNQWRIRYDGINNVNDLFIDSALPTTNTTEALRYKTQAVDTDARIFFSAPEYSLPALESVVQRIIDTQTTTLEISIEDAS